MPILLNPDGTKSMCPVNDFPLALICAPHTILNENVFWLERKSKSDLRALALANLFHYVARLRRILSDAQSVFRRKKRAEETGGHGLVRSGHVPDRRCELGRLCVGAV